jgi:hypothetical protein
MGVSSLSDHRNFSQIPSFYDLPPEALNNDPLTAV